MNIQSIEYDAGFLKLRVPYGDVGGVLKNFKPGEYELKAVRKKRSKTANAYAWELMGQIAEKVRRPVNEIYLQELECVTGIREQLIVHEDDVDAVTRLFIGTHEGRSVRRIGYDGEYVELLLTCGSSDFDSRQMGELIDAIIEDCKALEIDYESGKIKSLLEDMAINEK